MISLFGMRSRLVASVLVSCAGLAQAQVVAQEGSEESACYDRVSKLPQYQVLQGGFRQKPDAPIFVKYANTGKATEADKKLIAGYATEAQACFEASRQYRSDVYHPELRKIAEDGFRIYLVLVARVYNGELTYGEYHRLRDQADADVQAKVDRLQASLDSVNADAARQNAAVEQARRDAINAAVMGNAIQGVRDAFKQPVRTDCYRTGLGGMSCQTR